MLAPRAVSGEHVAAIVVAELHQHVVAFPDVGEDRIPAAFVQKGTAAAAADGAVDDLDLRRVELGHQRVAPAHLPAALGPYGGVADDPQRGLGAHGEHHQQNQQQNPHGEKMHPERDSSR